MADFVGCFLKSLECFIIKAMFCFFVSELLHWFFGESEFCASEVLTIVSMSRSKMAGLAMSLHGLESGGEVPRRVRDHVNLWGRPANGVVCVLVHDKTSCRK